MSYQAITDTGNLAFARDVTIKRATCPDPRCRLPVYRHGGVRIKGQQDAYAISPHWSHMPGTGELCTENKGEWHESWQARCPTENTEVTRGRRRADYLTSFGWAVEFQHTNLTTPDVHAREDDWNGQMIWVHDGTGHRRDSILVEDDIGDGLGLFTWRGAPSRLYAGRCHQLVDVGDETLVWLGAHSLDDRPDEFLRRARVLSVAEFLDLWINGAQPWFPLEFHESRWQEEERLGVRASVKKTITGGNATRAEMREREELSTGRFQCSNARLPCSECAGLGPLMPAMPPPPGYYPCEQHWPYDRQTGTREIIFEAAS